MGEPPGPGTVAHGGFPADTEPGCRSHQQRHTRFHPDAAPRPTPKVSISPPLQGCEVNVWDSLCPLSGLRPHSPEERDSHVPPRRQHPGSSPQGPAAPRPLCPDASADGHPSACSASSGTALTARPSEWGPAPGPCSARPRATSGLSTRRRCTARSSMVPLLLERINGGGNRGQCGWGGGGGKLPGACSAEGAPRVRGQQPGCARAAPESSAAPRLSRKPNTTDGRKLRRGPKGASTGKKGERVGGEGHAPHQDGPQCGATREPRARIPGRRTGTGGAWTLGSRWGAHRRGSNRPREPRREALLQPVSGHQRPRFLCSELPGAQRPLPSSPVHSR